MIFRRSRNKFGAVRSGDFPSKLEASVYDMLLLREKAGEIKDIKRQASVDLGFGIRWKVDFSFTEVATGETVYCEAKGQWTQDANLKKRMWKNGARTERLEIWQGQYRNPILVEVIIPKGKSNE